MVHVLIHTDWQWTSPRTFPYQIHKIKAFPQLKRIAVVENKSAVVLVR